MTTMTRISESTSVSGVLLLALALIERTWKLGFTSGRGQRPRVREIAAGAVDRLVDEVARAKARFRLAADAAVVSCYKAGREAFWLHRWAVAQGWTNYVVDSLSIEVNRRARRVKTDRLDLEGLLRLLARDLHGEDDVWRVVRVPSAAAEDARHLHRLRETLQQERTRLLNRLHGWLTTHGVRVPVPATQGAQGLIPQPTPGELDDHPSDGPIAGTGDALIMGRLSALIRGGHHANQARSTSRSSVPNNRSGIPIDVYGYPMTVGGQDVSRNVTEFQFQDDVPDLRHSLTRTDISGHDES